MLKPIKGWMRRWRDTRNYVDSKVFCIDARGGTEHPRGFY